MVLHRPQANIYSNVDRIHTLGAWCGRQIGKPTGWRVSRSTSLRDPHASIPSICSLYLAITGLVKSPNHLLFLVVRPIPTEANPKLTETSNGLLLILILLDCIGRTFRIGFKLESEWSGSSECDRRREWERCSSATNDVSIPTTILEEIFPSIQSKYGCPIRSPCHQKVNQAFAECRSLCRETRDREVRRSEGIG
jgi:hypothetical protein